MMFTGKVALVTGAGRGIGRAVALAYTEAGASVVIIDKEAAMLAETVGLIASREQQVISAVIDVRRPREIEDLFVQISKELGRLDILINNAGVGFMKSPYDITVEEWDDVLAGNLRGTFLCAREAAKIMRTHGGGSIVNLASTRATMSEPHWEAYAASKGGILGLTHALALSLGPDHIRVNAISPGWIETGDYAKLRDDDHRQHPAGRVGRPDDIARACLYLTDPSNDFITGANLVIDGGMTRKMIYEE
nr:glucose 1-dehydrogenase [Heliophilum fasciatum]